MLHTIFCVFMMAGMFLVCECALDYLSMSIQIFLMLKNVLLYQLLPQLLLQLQQLLLHSYLPPKPPPITMHTTAE